MRRIDDYFADGAGGAGMVAVGLGAHTAERRPVRGLAFVTLAMLWLVAWAPMALYCGLAIALEGRWKRRNQATF